MSVFLDNESDTMGYRKRGEHMDYKQEILNAIDKIHDEGQLAYLYTFIMWLLEQWHVT